MRFLKWCVVVLGLCFAPSEVRGGDAGILRMVQSGDCNYLLTLSAQRVAAVWKVGASKPLATYQIKGLPDGIAFHPTKKTALISDGSGFVEWDWSKKNSKPQPIFSPRANTKEAIQDSNNVQRLDISADGKVLAFRDTLGNIKLQEIPEGKARTIAKVELSSQFQAWIRYLPATKFLAFNDSGDIHIYDMARMQKYCVLRGDKEDEVSSLEISPDGKLIAIGNWEGSARVWNIEKKGVVKIIDTGKGETGKGEQPIALCFSPDGTRFGCAGTTEIAVYQTKDMKSISKWKGPKGGVCALVITKDNNTIITVGEDPHPRYWDAKTGKERRPEKG